MRGKGKRRRSDSSSGPEQRKAPRRDAENRKLPTLPNGSFRIEINLRSESKAERNDPKSRSYWRKLFERVEEQEDCTDTETSETSADENNELTSTNDIPPLDQVNVQQLDDLTAIPPFSSHTSWLSDDEDRDEQDSSENNFDSDLWNDNSTYDSEYDEFSHWEWLEQMDGKVLWTPPDGSEDVTVGHCSGKLIRRTKIQDIFHDEIEERSTNTSELGFGLFDRYGRLKPEFKTHPVKKGSGVWQNELDRGDILLVDYIHVEPMYRRRALGRQVFTDMFERAREKTKGGFFAIVRPGYPDRESKKEMGNVSGEAKKESYRQAENVARQFWRQLGFRRIGSSLWFGLASKPGHACHRLQTSDDYDPPVPMICEPNPVNEAIRKTIYTMGDEECVEHFKQKLQDVVTGDPLWRATDEQGNTFLHIAAISCKPKVVKYILQRTSDTNLLDFRNNDGDTPLEALLVYLETKRTKRGSHSFFRIEPWSDKFEGFDNAAVECLALLKCISQLSHIEKLRLTYGCTCGHCIGGFLSPRMSFALLCQAEVNYDTLHEACSDYSGPEFVEDSEDEVRFLRPSVRANLATNKSMREGFVAFFEHFATCIKNKELPTEPFIMQAMRNCSEWPPVSRNFLQRGGTVYSVGSVIFDKAMQQDMWAGDGHHWDVFKKDIRELPQCRNDHEFGFVSAMCGFKQVSNITHVSPWTGEPIDDD